MSASRPWFGNSYRQLFPKRRPAQVKGLRPFAAGFGNRIAMTLETSMRSDQWKLMVLALIALALSIWQTKSGATPASASARLHRAVPASKITSRPAPPAVTLPAGTALRIRLNKPVSDARFSGSLASDVASDGEAVLPAGAPVSGYLERSDASGSGEALQPFTMHLTAISLETGTLEVSTVRELAAIGGSDDDTTLTFHLADPVTIPEGT